MKSLFSLIIVLMALMATPAFAAGEHSITYDYTNPATMPVNVNDSVTMRFTATCIVGDCDFNRVIVQVPNHSSVQFNSVTVNPSTNWTCNYAPSLRRVSCNNTGFLPAGYSATFDVNVTLTSFLSCSHSVSNTKATYLTRVNTIAYEVQTPIKKVCAGT